VPASEQDRSVQRPQSFQGTRGKEIFQEILNYLKCRFFNKKHQQQFESGHIFYCMATWLLLSWIEYWQFPIIIAFFPWQHFWHAF